MFKAVKPLQLLKNVHAKITLTYSLKKLYYYGKQLQEMLWKLLFSVRLSLVSRWGIWNFLWERKKANSLDKLLDVFDIENLLPYFAGINNNIASNITNAEGYLHQNIVNIYGEKSSKFLEKSSAVQNQIWNILKENRKK